MEKLKIGKIVGTHKMEKKSLQYLMLELFCVPQKI